jgi:multicomponent K+:H+ antiporter subunit A
MLLAAVVAPLLIALLMAALNGRRVVILDNAALIAALLPAVLVVASAGQVSDGGVIRQSLAWMPDAGLNIALRMDGFAWIMAMLVSCMTTLIVWYARYYLKPEDCSTRFYALLLAFESAMLGVVLSGNLMLLAICWELTTLTSFLLVGYWHHKEGARDGARLTLVMTGLGGLCLFAGLILLGQIVGSMDLDEVLRSGDRIRADDRYPLMLVLVLIGAFTKSAQFPFHFWLPQAMAAPTPVSALLHSATLVKLGVFLMARLHPALSGTDLWLYIVTGTGLITLALGAWHAIFQQDIKALLAYSTISHLGLITVLLGLGTPLAVLAAVFHLLNHALFKASLFMAAGIIDHEAGTRDFRKLKGLWKFMPYTGALAIVASLAMAGVPFFNGFLSKEMFLAETLTLQNHPFLQMAVPVIALLAGICAVAYSLRFVHDAFFSGTPTGLDKEPHEPPRWMRLPIEVLLVLCIVVGIVPNLTIAPLLAMASKAILGANAPQFSLAIWHGFNMPLLMSISGLVGGAVLYLTLLRRVDLHQIERSSRGRSWFETALEGLRTLSARLTRELEFPSLQSGLLLLLGFVVLAGALPFFQNGVDLQLARINVATAYWQWPILLLTIAGCAVTVRSQHRLQSVIVVGLLGLLLSLVFALLSAPDLALTQILIEIASAILLLIALRQLPRVQANPSERRSHIVFALPLAIAAGCGVALLSWLTLGQPMYSVSSEMLAGTLTLAGGANTVNTIIVDYRGFDTLGEITVLVVTALIIDAQRPLKLPSKQRANVAIDPGLLADAAHVLYPLGILLSAHFFMRGHNLPGGGFIAGLVLVLALLLVWIGQSRGRIAEQADARPLHIMAWGIALATLTGMASLALSHPFLTSSTPHLTLPLLGEIHLPSATLFDAGVWLAVVGASLVLLERTYRLVSTRPAGVKK